MNSFRLQALLRLTLLIATVAACFHFYIALQYAAAVCAAAASAAQIYLMFRFMDKTNAEIIRFLQGINFSDFSQNTRMGSLGSSFKELSDELERIIANFRQARIEREESLHYLQTVVEHVEIGLICFDAKGDVTLYNKTAGRMLSMPYLKNLSALNRKHERLSDVLLQMTPNMKRTYKVASNGAAQELLIAAAEFRMKEHPMKLISLHNIQQELEANEIEAWQKLIKVLTHEIMNSIAPISSLASTVDVMLKSSAGGAALAPEAIEDIGAAVGTIHKRSEGLIHFVNKYRDISRTPRPNFQPVNVSELVYRVRLLMERAFAANDIRCTVSVAPERLQILADPELMEQVLLNLVNNSIHALAETADKRITITAGVDEKGKTVIRVADNGGGIPEEIVDKIFIPFFSTKQEGSGIGLSISQRIVRTHGGSLRAASHPNGDTVFTIELPAA
jgi:two-component system, NtrC family, nitrogen regulation sensor histidine kinase NtrY